MFELAKTIRPGLHHLIEIAFVPRRRFLDFFSGRKNHALVRLDAHSISRKFDRHQKTGRIGRK